MKDNSLGTSFRVNKNLIMLLAAFFIIVNLQGVLAQLYYPLDKVIDLKVPCTLNDYPCSNSALCNLSVTAPNSTYLVNNQQMSYNAGGDFNYTLIFYNAGTHNAKVSCSQSGLNGTSTFEIIVNQAGTELSTPKGILYVVFLIFGVGIFILTLAGAIKIPFHNTVNDEGRIISVNDLKYVKIFLMVMCYAILLMLFGLLRGITATYLYDTGVAEFFGWGYWILLSALFPIVVCAFIFAFIMFITDKKITKALERGLPFR